MRSAAPDARRAEFQPPAARVDDVAQPAVPSLAPDTHPRRDRAVVLLFVAFLALPSLGAWVNQDMKTTRFENRATTPWPAVPSSPAALREWPKSFESAFADRFGGRDELTRLHHYAHAVVFGVSPVSKVLIGRDRWLYFLGEDGKALDRDFRGVIPLPEGQPAAIAAEFTRRHDWLANLGSRYVVMLVPDKSTIHPEHLPRWVSRSTHPTRLELVVDRLAAARRVTVVDVRHALLAAKSREPQYFRTDSHWSTVGAVTGYTALSVAVASVVPAYPSVPPARPAHTPGVDRHSGDLAVMLGLVRQFREDDPAPLSKLMASVEQGCARRVDDGKDRDREVWACDDARLPTAVMFRDSMAIPLIPMLAPNFRRIVFVSGHRMDPALIRAERPDVVIEEMVERALDAPLAYPLR